MNIQHDWCPLTMSVCALQSELGRPNVRVMPVDNFQFYYHLWNFEVDVGEYRNKELWL